MDAGLGDYPLVLHGASSVPKDLAEEINKYGGKLGTDTAGVPEADIEIARRVGCTKVNIDTDLRLAMTAAIRKVLFENPKEFDPRKYLAPARTKVKELVRHKIKNVLCRGAATSRWINQTCSAAVKTQHEHGARSVVVRRSQCRCGPRNRSRRSRSSRPARLTGRASAGK